MNMNNIWFKHKDNYLGIMPTYINKTLADVVLDLRCPFCSNNYRSKSGLIKHIKHCKENPDPELILDDAFIMDDISASDMIKWQEEVIKLIKELTISNELSLIQTQTPEQIRKNIRERMKTRTDNDYIEEYDIYRIYEFFFELTEADINNRKQEKINRIMQFIDSQVF